MPDRLQLSDKLRSVKLPRPPKIRERQISTVKEFSELTDKRQLMSRIDQEVEAATGIKDWDPIVMMAVIAAKAFNGYYAVDDEGNPVTDEDGNQEYIAPDYTLAASVGSKIAPYIHAQFKTIERKEGEKKEDSNARSQAEAIARRLGLEGDDEDSA